MTSPEIAFRRLDLPLPLAPTIPSRCRGSTWKLRSRSTSVAPYNTASRSTRSSGMSVKVYGCLPEAASSWFQLPGINAARIRFAKATWILNRLKWRVFDDRIACPDQRLHPRCRAPVQDLRARQDQLRRPVQLI